MASRDDMIPIWIRLLGSKLMTKESYAIRAGKRDVFFIFFSFISKLFQTYFQNILTLIKVTQYKNINDPA
jgi:hypothetical protein